MFPLVELKIKIKTCLTQLDITFTPDKRKDVRV